MPYQTVVVAVLVVATATILYFLSNREPAYTHGGSNSQPPPPPPDTSFKGWERCDDNKRRRKHSTRSVETTCIICFDDLTEGVQALPCEHKFHSKCINKWLSQKGNEKQACPLCRKSATQ